MKPYTFAKWLEKERRTTLEKYKTARKSKRDRLDAGYQKYMQAWEKQGVRDDKSNCN